MDKKKESTDPMVYMQPYIGVVPYVYLFPTDEDAYNIALQREIIKKIKSLGFILEYKFKSTTTIDAKIIISNPTTTIIIKHSVPYPDPIERVKKFLNLLSEANT